MHDWNALKMDYYFVTVVEPLFQMHRMEIGAIFCKMQYPIKNVKSTVAKIFLKEGTSFAMKLRLFFPLL